MPTNFYMLFVTALIPMFVGAIYYSDALLGKSWKATNGFTDEFLAKGNMPLILGVSYIFSLFITLNLYGMVIHQMHIFQVMLPPGGAEWSAELKTQYHSLMSQFGENYRSFGHGAFHGVILALLFVMPLIGINSLFERRGWKYILIHGGYWLITLVLMGGVLCSTLEFDLVPK